MSEFPQFHNVDDNDKGKKIYTKNGAHTHTQREVMEVFLIFGFDLFFGINVLISLISLSVNMYIIK